MGGFPWDIGRISGEEIRLFAGLLENLPEPRDAPIWRNVRDFGATGDGRSDDTEAVQAALQYADVVYFPAGRYRIGTTFSHVRVTGKRGLTLIGDGSRSVLLRGVADDVNVTLQADLPGATQDLEANWGEGMLEFEDCSDLTIRGLRLEPSGFTPPLVDHGQVDGVVRPGGDRNPLDAAIVLRRCTRVRVTEVVVEEDEDVLYRLGGLRVEILSHRFCLQFVDCTDVALTSSLFNRVGVWGSKLNRARIADNTFLDVQGHAITLDAGTSRLTYVDVCDNLIRGCTGFGIHVDARGGEGGVDCRRLRVHRNVVRRPIGLPAGIVVYAGETAVADPTEWTHMDISVVGNEIDFRPQGVADFAIADVDDTAWRQSPLNLNEAYGILVHLPYTPESEADQVGVFKFCVIQDNVVRACLSQDGGGIGFALSNMFGAAISGNGAFSCDQGLRLGSSYRCHIYSNRVERSPSGGVEYDLGSSLGDNVCSGNAVLGSPHQAEWAGSSGPGDTFVGDTHSGQEAGLGGG